MEITPDHRPTEADVASQEREVRTLRRVRIAKMRNLRQVAAQQHHAKQLCPPRFHGEWESKQLKEIGHFLKGCGVKRDDARTGSLACVRYGEIYTKHHDFIRDFNSWISSQVAATATRLEYGDILFAGSGETKAEIGKSVALVSRTEAYAGGDIVILRPRNIDPLFFGYALNMPAVARQKARFGQGDAVVHVSAAALAGVKVSVPSSIEEQAAISGVLFDVDALLDGLDRLIAKKQDLKQAAMQQLLTCQTRLPGFESEWDMKRLGEFALCTAGGTPSTLVPEYWDGSIRWMSSSELHLKYIHDVGGRITEFGLLNSSAKMLPTRSVLIGLAGQGKTRGTVAINLVPLCTNQSIAAILRNSEFVPEFLYHYLDSKYDELRDISSGGGGRGGLNLTLIRSILIPFPSVSEQNAIAAILTDMDDEIAALEARRAKTRDLKQAMLQELLSGSTRLVKPEVAHA